MKKILFTALCAALILTSFASCKKEDKKKDEAPETVIVTDENGSESIVEIPETVTGEPEYELVPIDSYIYDPDGNLVESLPMPEFDPIAEDALVQSVDDIIGLDELIAGYQLCYNYDFTYDDSVIFEGNYYLVTDDAAIDTFKTECTKYFEEGKYPACIIEKEGNFYYKPVEKDITLTLDTSDSETGINYSEENICELSYTDGTSSHNIEFAENNGSFKISYTTVE